MDKLLTIVVPVYNTEKYLDKCLSSLVVPNYMDQLEVIVVIDGSPDDSINVARKYEEKYPNSFIVIDKENGGHGSCCNVGLKEATGKYIRFLDSDDWFDSTSLVAFLQKISGVDVDIVQSNYATYYEKRDLYVRSNFYQAYAGKVWEADNFDYSQFVRFITLSTSTFSVKCLRDSHIIFTEKAQFDDTILYIQPLCMAKKIYFLNEIVYYYYIGREGQSVGTITDKKLQYRYFEFQKLCNEYLKVRDSISEKKRTYADRLIQNVVLEEYYYWSFMMLGQGTNLKAWHRYVKSLPFIRIKDMKYGALYEKYPYILLWLYFYVRHTVGLIKSKIVN